MTAEARSDNRPAEQHGALGRYAPTGAAEDLVEVVLLHFPLQLFVASRERHDDLMREFALLAVRPREDGDRPLPERLMALVELLGRQYAGAAQRADAHRDEAIARGDETADLRYLVPRSVAPAIEQLAALMAEADTYCVAEELLTLAPSQVDADFRQWFCAEFIEQVNGRPATPWAGPLHP